MSCAVALIVLLAAADATSTTARRRRRTMAAPHHVHPHDAEALAEDRFQAQEFPAATEYSGVLKTQEAAIVKLVDMAKTDLTSATGLTKSMKDMLDADNKAFNKDIATEKAVTDAITKAAKAVEDKTHTAEKTTAGDVAKIGAQKQADEDAESGVKTKALLNQEGSSQKDTADPVVDDPNVNYQKMMTEADSKAIEEQVEYMQKQFEKIQEGVKALWGNFNAEKQKVNSAYGIEKDDENKDESASKKDKDMESEEAKEAAAELARDARNLAKIAGYGKLTKEEVLAEKDRLQAKLDALKAQEAALPK